MYIDFNHHRIRNTDFNKLFLHFIGPKANQCELNNANKRGNQLDADAEGQNQVET